MFTSLIPEPQWFVCACEREAFECVFSGTALAQVHLRQCAICRQSQCTWSRVDSIDFVDKCRTLMVFESPIQYFTFHESQFIRSLRTHIVQCMWHATLFAYYLCSPVRHCTSALYTYTNSVRWWFFYLFLFVFSYALHFFATSFSHWISFIHSAILYLAGGSIMPFVHNSRYSLRFSIHNVNTHSTNEMERNKSKRRDAGCYSFQMSFATIHSPVYTLAPPSLLCWVECMTYTFVGCPF